jgi:hypothetical protein
MAWISGNINFYLGNKKWGITSPLPLSFLQERGI